jgi:hypothetical protein
LLANTISSTLSTTPHNKWRQLRPPAMSAGFLQHHCLDPTLKNGIRESWPFLRVPRGGANRLDLQTLLRRRSDVKTKLRE